MNYWAGLTARLDDRVEQGIGRIPEWKHRALSEYIEANVYAWVSPQSRFYHDQRVWEMAHQAITRLDAWQRDDGLFLRGDNVLSPPDTAFTVNNIAKLTRVVRHEIETADGQPDAALTELAGLLDPFLSRSARALVHGGVHTPNHRWEISCALVQLYALTGDEALLERAHAWLGEGIDLQADGLFSERSPNYAVYVSGPCLLTMAELLDRNDLAQAVHTNLHATSHLVDDDGNVETIVSRRQDQRSGFRIGPYETLYRHFALEGCQLCHQMAERAAADGGAEILAAVSDGIIHPDHRADLPALPDGQPGQQKPRHQGWHLMEPTGLAIWQGKTARLVARASRDVTQLNRYASGTSCDPSFAHYRCGGLWLSSFRLAKEFFSLGPMRASEIALDHDSVVLTETVSASYYQPLDHDARRDDGVYDYEFEGRFAAAMSFSARQRDVLRQTTEVRLTPYEDGLDLQITTRGDCSDFLLEIGLNTPGQSATGSLSGHPARPLIHDAAPVRWPSSLPENPRDQPAGGQPTGDHPTEPAAEFMDLGGGNQAACIIGNGTLMVGGIPLHITLGDRRGGEAPSPYLSDYDPGEMLSFLGANDAITGPRILIPVWPNRSMTISLRVGEPA